MRARLAVIAPVFVLVAACSRLPEPQPVSAPVAASPAQTANSDAEFEVALIEGSLRRFESSSANAEKLIYAFGLCRRCITTILDAEGRRVKTAEGLPITKPEEPPATSDKTVADATTMTIRYCGSEITITRGEFPEYTAVNDMLWRIWPDGQSAPRLPDDLVAQIRARAQEAIAVARTPAK